MNKFHYLITYLILVLILYFGIGKLNAVAIIIPAIITSILYIMFDLLHPVIEQKRKKRVNEFFKLKYADSSILKPNGDILFNFRNENILIEYHCDNIIGTYLHNSIHINIDVSTNEQRLIDLIKIHFHTKEKYNKLWIEKVYKPLFRKRSINYITKKSEKEVSKAIDEYRNYIDKKNV